jgi:hypothetical protein
MYPDAPTATTSPALDMVTERPSWPYTVAPSNDSTSFILLLSMFNVFTLPLLSFLKGTPMAMALQSWRMLTDNPKPSPLEPNISAESSSAD